MVAVVAKISWPRTSALSRTVEYLLLLPEKTIRHQWDTSGRFVRLNDGYFIVDHFCQRDFVGFTKKSLIIRKINLFLRLKMARLCRDFVTGLAVMAEACLKHP